MRCHKCKKKKFQNDAYKLDMPDTYFSKDIKEYSLRMSLAAFEAAIQPAPRDENVEDKRKNGVLARR